MSAVHVLRQVDDLLGRLPSRGPLDEFQNDEVTRAHKLVCDELRRRRQAPWHEDSANRAALYEWLQDRAEAPTGQTLIEYLAKPWRWDAEWNDMQRDLDLDLELAQIVGA